MGYYDQIGDAGAGIRTPGYVLAEIQTTDTAVKSLALDIAKSTTNPTYRDAWQKFADEWEAFRAEYGSGIGAWLARGTTPIYQKAIDYRRRLKEWQDSFRAAGGAVSQADKPATGAESSSAGWLGWLPWIGLGAVLVGVGGYLLLRPSTTNHGSTP